jgi:hypothetical protein
MGSDDADAGPVALIVSHDHDNAARLAALALEAGCTPTVIGSEETGAGALTTANARIAIVDADYGGELGDFFFHLAKEMGVPVVIVAATPEPADPELVSFALDQAPFEAKGRDGLLRVLRAAITVG